MQTQTIAEPRAPRGYRRRDQIWTPDGHELVVPLTYEKNLERVEKLLTMAGSGAGIGLGRSSNLWTKPFPLFPLTVSGLLHFIWGPAMVHTGQGSVITSIVDLSPFASNASSITAPVTADLEKFNGHASAFVNTGGHWEHNGAALTAISTATNPSWAAYFSIKLETSSVLSMVGWANTVVDARWDLQISRGGGTRDLAIIKRRDTGTTTSNDGVIRVDHTPTSFNWTNVVTTVTATIGGVNEPLTAGGVQNSGALTADVNNVFTYGAQIVSGVATAVSQMYVRAGLVYSPPPSATDHALLLEWLANDAYQYE